MKHELTGYQLTDDWFEFVEEHPELITLQETALMFRIIQLWNRLNKPSKFGLPTESTMRNIGTTNYKAYRKALINLNNWGFIRVFYWSKNQFKATQIGVLKNTPKNWSDRLKNPPAEPRPLWPIDQSKEENASENTPKHLPKHFQSTSGIDKCVEISRNEYKDSNSIELDAGEKKFENFSEQKPEHQDAEKERKKSSAEKKKENVDPGLDNPLSDPGLGESATPFWPEIVKLWHQFNTEQLQLKVSFKGRDPKSLKWIALLLQQRTREAGHEWTKTKALHVLQQFLQAAITDPWLKNHFLLANLENQFDIIYHKIFSYDNNTNRNGNPAHFEASGRNGKAAGNHTDNERYRYDRA